MNEVLAARTIIPGGTELIIIFFVILPALCAYYMCKNKGAKIVLFGVLLSVFLSWIGFAVVFFSMCVANISQKDGTQR